MVSPVILSERRAGAPAWIWPKVRPCGHLVPRQPCTAGPRIIRQRLWRTNRDRLTIETTARSPKQSIPGYDDIVICTRPVPVFRGHWCKWSFQNNNNNNIYTPFCSKASGTSTLNSVLETFYGTKTNTLLGSAHLLRVRCAYDMFSSLTH